MESRRNFIKNSCFACLGLTGFGSILNACSTPQSVFVSSLEQNRLMIPLSEFAGTSFRIVRNRSAEYDVFIHKNGDIYEAIEMRCTHNDIALRFTGQKLICNAHGSEFDLKGQVIKEPASKPLRKFKTSINAQQLLIHLV